MKELIYNAPQLIVGIISLLASISSLGIGLFSFVKSKKENKKPGKTLGLSLLVVVLIAIFYIIFDILKSHMIRVPNLTEWTYYNAIQTLDERNISYEFASEDFDKSTAKITYQSFGESELIFSWEKLVLEVDNNSVIIVDSPSGGTTTVMSSSSTLPHTSTSSSTGTPVEENPKELSMRVPTNRFLESDINAVLIGSTLNIEISKSLQILEEANGNYPFRWGLYLSDSIEEKVNDYIIEVEVSIDEKYSVLSVDLNVMLVKENSTMMVESLNNNFSGFFNGEKFVLSGDISNEYIELSDLCIQTVYYV